MKSFRSLLVILLVAMLCVSAFVSCDNADINVNVHVKDPTEAPTNAPTEAPTKAPTQTPTEKPTDAPTEAPTTTSTEGSATVPTEGPTNAPTEAPTQTPTEAPTTTPTEKPTTVPTEKPTTAPTEKPTTTPTEKPADTPTENPNEPSEKYPTITIAEALAICGDEPSSAPTTERYYIRATITEMLNASYGEMTLTDETGSIYVWGTYSFDGVLKFNQLDEKPAVGDEVLIHATLQNYNGKKEVKNARLIEFKKGKNPTEPPVQKPEDGAEITIAQAIEIAKAQGETATTERYIIKGTVVSIDKAQYGAMTITDGTDTIVVYGTYSADGSIGYADMTDKPYKGDSVVLSCTLHAYNGTPEIKNARLISFEKNEVEVDQSQYTEMSVSEARDAAKGTKIKVDGVVARITYANGMKPTGVYLVDGTQSIYVYDGDLAQRVKIGNTVTILAEKDYWILEDEQTNAEKFGYNGCCQLTDVYLLDIDESKVDFDKTWIPTSTIKDIVDTPVTVDISSTIFKVNALVKKVPGQGFVNYYFFDLDEKTSSYVYTQCNGGDFTWLDEFDGKICTVYLSALNAKSTASDCYWRFIPVAVIDENFAYDTKDAPEFALKYYAMEQFMPEYAADPALELISSVSSTLLGFENVVITYTSSDNNVVYFETVEGKTYMHCGKAGEATVTVTATYGEITATDTYTIKVTVSDDIDSVGVKEAIDSANNTEVTVKGIVGPSLANKVGFYLIDETGVIAVQVNSSEFEGLKIGHEIVVKGTRTITKDGGGQICLENATILANNYGSHEYSTETFISGKTVADLCELKDTAEATTSVYVVTATISRVVTGYSTNTYLVDGDSSFMLYAGGPGNYAWLDQFNGQTVTVEVAVCDWNAKGLKGCVLSVITEDGQIFNELNFNK